MAQRKIMEIHEGKWHYICIKTDEAINPYRLYRVWWNAGNHRKLITKYGEFQSVMWTLHQIIDLGWSEELFIDKKKAPTA